MNTLSRVSYPKGVWIYHMSQNSSFHKYFKKVATGTDLITSTLILSTIMDHKSLVVVVWIALLLTQWIIPFTVLCVELFSP